MDLFPVVEGAEAWRWLTTPAIAEVENASLLWQHRRVTGCLIQCCCKKIWSQTLNCVCFCPSSQILCTTSVWLMIRFISSFCLPFIAIHSSWFFLQFMAPVRAFLWDILSKPNTASNQITIHKQLSAYYWIRCPLPIRNWKSVKQTLCYRCCDIRTRGLFVRLHWRFQKTQACVECKPSCLSFGWLYLLEQWLVTNLGYAYPRLYAKTC